MDNTDLLVAREAELIKRSGDLSLDKIERRLAHTQAMEIHEQLAKDKEIELKIKNDKFNKVVDTVSKIGIPIVKGIGIAAFTIGVIKIQNNFEKDGYYSTNVGKGISNIPTRLISSILTKM